jgi:hypothetical protein
MMFLQQDVEEKRYVIQFQRRKTMSQEFEESLIISPTLHHFGLVARNIEVTIDWYGKVLGMFVMLQCSFANEITKEGRCI